MISITGRIEKEPYKTTISNGSHSIIADEKLVAGGADMGLNPSELLASALAACTCITLRMYADRKKWLLDAVDTLVIIEGTSMKRSITLNGDLTEEQRNRLLQIAEHCPIHKLLEHPIPIQTILK